MGKSVNIDYLDELIDVFAMEEMMDILTGLIRRKSENIKHTEEEVARFIQEILSSNGIKVELSWVDRGRPNVVAKLKGKRPGKSIIFNGHLDVVPAGVGWTRSPYGAQIENDKLYGRGSSDMKSGIASMIYSAILLNRIGNPYDGELILYFNVDEEGQNIGIKKFLSDSITADYAVIGEPTSLDVCIGHKGCARFLLKTFGKQIHASYASTEDNAIYKMGRIVSALEEFKGIVSKKTDPIIGNATVTVTEIKGGIAHNIIPDYCEINIDRRTIPAETKEEVLLEIDNYLSSVSNRFGFEYDLDNYLFLPSTIINSNHPLVEKLCKSIYRVNRSNPRIIPFNATCEAPYFSQNKNIPTVIFGPGHLDQAHNVDEFVDINNVKVATLVYADLVLEILKD
jgi:succinyl-diaminopimelate desuccinylase